MTPEKMTEIDDKRLSLKRGYVWLEAKATYPKGHPERTTTITLPMSVDEARTLTKFLLRPGGLVAADLALTLHESDRRGGGRKS